MEIPDSVSEAEQRGHKETMCVQKQSLPTTLDVHGLSFGSGVDSAVALKTGAAANLVPFR